MIAYQPQKIPVNRRKFILNFEEIELIFGRQISNYVETMTKGVSLASDPVGLSAYHAKLFEASEKLRILKLADRLHNLRTLDACTLDKQIRQIRETLNIFLPLAQQTHEYLYQKIKEICDEYCRKFPQAFLDLKPS